jgi:Putative Flp pilus-assembly TadE/G-like
MASKRKSESGQVMVLAAGAMILIIGVAALAVDLGFLYATRRNMQTAADAAAIAGSNALEHQCGTTADCTCDSVKACSAAGTDVAQLNGISASAANSPTITVATATTAPANNPNPGSGTFVQATVSETVPTFFMRALGIPTVNITTTAIAGFAPEGPCMRAFDTVDPQTIEVTGSGTINATCPLQDDSSNNDGFDSNGGTITASSIALAALGPWSGNRGGTVTPTPSTGDSIPPNPYSGLVPPPPCSASGGCTGAKCNTLTAANPNNGYSVSSTPSGPISPGVYCGGIAVSGNSTVLKLNPGTYILINQHGNLVSSGAMQGTGVTFYNTYSGNANNYRPIVFSGSSSTNLAAPTSGPYAGVLFYQDTKAELPPSKSNNQETVSGSAGATFTGALYFPNSPLVFSGGTSTNTENATLYAWTITVSGSAALSNGTGGPGEVPAVNVSRLYQ